MQLTHLCCLAAQTFVSGSMNKHWFGYTTADFLGCAWLRLLARPNDSQML